ncbi:MAG: hypothetical protein K1W36_14615 [Lachnospiraceae bacterium]|jgi:hypothetical protein|nr:hypothetical protein [Lachnospiraceae bacterium]
MDFFSNANFIDSEINDSIGNAQIIGTENAFTGGSVTGIIDTIKDMDYYKLNITSPMMIHINFDAPENHSMVWINTDSSAERLYYSNGNCILSTGVHYFAVYDTKGYSYTKDGAYTVSLDVISGNVTSDLKATAYIDYPQYSAILQ